MQAPHLPEPVGINGNYSLTHEKISVVVELEEMMCVLHSAQLT